MADYRECYYTSPDGLRLFYRDYATPSAATPVLCIPGLTRNSRDFDFIASHIADKRRVFCADLRGRGKSSYDPNWRNYIVPVEARDMLSLMAAAAVPRAIVLGTSRGGIIAMVMAAMKPEALAAVILNDMGAQLEARGMQRIYDNLQPLAPSFASWEEAADTLKRRSAGLFENVSDARWLEFAKAIYRENGGRIVGDYDPNFPMSVLELRGSNPRTEEGDVDLSRPFSALSTIPTLVLRGANSDLLSAETVSRMKTSKPDLISVEIKDRAHVPFLDEPDAVEAIDAFLARIP